MLKIDSEMSLLVQGSCQQNIKLSWQNSIVLSERHLENAGNKNLNDKLD